MIDEKDNANNLFTKEFNHMSWIRYFYFYIIKVIFEIILFYFVSSLFEIQLKNLSP